MSYTKSPACFRDCSNSTSRSRQNPDYAAYILAAIRTWIEKPEVVFAKSVTHRLIWQLLVKEFSLERYLKDVLEGIDLEAFALKSRYFKQCDLEWWKTDNFPEALAGEVRRLSTAKMEPNDREYLVRLRRELVARFSRR